MDAAFQVVKTPRSPFARDECRSQSSHSERGVLSPAHPNVSALRPWSCPSRKGGPVFALDAHAGPQTPRKRSREEQNYDLLSPNKRARLGPANLETCDAKDENVFHLPRERCGSERLVASAASLLEPDSTPHQPAAHTRVATPSPSRPARKYDLTAPPSTPLVDRTNDGTTSRRAQDLGPYDSRGGSSSGEAASHIASVPTGFATRFPAAFSHRPQGIANPKGTICWLNSGYQMLLSIPCIVEKAVAHLRRLPLCTKRSREGCALCEVGEVLVALLNPVSPQDSHHVVLKSLEAFNAGGNEHLHWAVDRHNCAAGFMQGVLEDFRNEDEISDHLSIKVHSSRSCKNQETCSCTASEASPLQAGLIGLTIKDKASLREALDSWVEEHDAVCAGGKAISRTVEWALVIFFQLGLETFEKIPGTNLLKKYDNNVTYPERIQTGTDGPWYELVGVITHHGETLQSGHYRAHTRGADGKWTKFDDDQVYNLPSAPVDLADAYLLAYQLEEVQEVEVPPELLVGRPQGDRDEDDDGSDPEDDEHDHWTDVDEEGEEELDAEDDGSPRTRLRYEEDDQSEDDDEVLGPAEEAEDEAEDEEPDPEDEDSIENGASAVKGKRKIECTAIDYKGLVGAVCNAIDGTSIPASVGKKVRRMMEGKGSSLGEDERVALREGWAKTNSKHVERVRNNRDLGPAVAEKIIPSTKNVDAPGVYMHYAPRKKDKRKRVKPRETLWDWPCFTIRMIEAAGMSRDKISAVDYLPKETPIPYTGRTSIGDWVYDKDLSTVKKHAALYRGVNERSNAYIWDRVRASTSTVVVGKAARLATMRGLNRLRFHLGLRFRELTVPIAVPGVQDGTLMLPDTTYMATVVVTWLPDGRVSLFLMTPHFCIASMQTTLEPDLFQIAQWQDATLRALRETAGIDHPPPSAPTFAGLVASKLAARKAKGTILACRDPGCGETFEWGHQRRKHERQEHGHLGLECAVCGKTFARLCDRKIHERTHTGEKPYECRYCPKRFPTSGARGRHERTHTSEKPYECGYCHRRFAASGVCTRHERTHTGEKPYECRYCRRAFASSSECTRHERTHTGEKPYECKYCPRRFGRLCDRKIHERTHTSEKPYECRYCPKRFPTSGARGSHERTHTGEKPYECGYCHRRFAKPAHVRRHQATHTKTPPAFSCSSCNGSFSREQAVKQHISKASRGLLKRLEPSTHANATVIYHPERLLPAQTERLGHGLQAQRCVWKFVLGGKTFRTVAGGITEGRVHVDGDVEQGGADTAIGELDEVEWSTMEAFLHLSTWEHMVQRIHTVQPGDDNTLRVWFVIKDDESGEESYVFADSAICAEKFPQKLLQFYEGHLHWRPA